MVEKHNGHFVYKIYYDEKSTNLFKQKQQETTWDNIKNIKEPSEGYRKFLEILAAYAKVFFQRRELE